MKDLSATLTAPEVAESQEATLVSKSSNDEQQPPTIQTPDDSPPVHAQSPGLPIQNGSTEDPEYFHRKLSKSTTGGSASGRARAGTRSATRSGGMQVTLGETGSWSDLAEKNTTLPAEGKSAAAAGAKNQKSPGMLGFLKGKGTRARSPKPREPGVLGKEGARVVISSGK